MRRNKIDACANDVLFLFYKEQVHNDKKQKYWNSVSQQQYLGLLCFLKQKTKPTVNELLIDMDPLTPNM